jgi:RNA polymerase sigma-70 factor, ECF subfamily
MEAYERYGRALIRKAERMLRSKEDARDVVHATFADMLERRAPAEAAPDLAFLYRAVTNRCLSFLRDERNRARLLALHDDALFPARTRLDDAALSMDLLVKLVGALDEDEATVLAYRYLDDMTQDEIAELLGLSRKTIGKRLDAIREAASRLAAEVAS